MRAKFVATLTMATLVLSGCGLPLYGTDDITGPPDTGNVGVPYDAGNQTDGAVVVDAEAGSSDGSGSGSGSGSSSGGSSSGGQESGSGGAESGSGSGSSSGGDSGGVEAGIPAGWNVVEVSLPGGATPVCGISWNTPVGVLGDTPTSPAAICGCSCGSPSVACSVTMTPSSSPGCNDNGAPFTVSPAACRSTSNNDNVLNSSAEVAGAGACASQPSVQLPPWAWTNTAVVCAPSNPGAMPAADQNFQVCLSHPGVAQCPAGTPYQTQIVKYAQADDGRSCTSCTCSAPANVACNGAMYFYSDQACTTQYGSSRAARSSQTCLGVLYGGSMLYEVAPTGACAPSTVAAAGSVTVDSASATTFCCEP